MKVLGFQRHVSQTRSPTKLNRSGSSSDVQTYAAETAKGVAELHNSFRLEPKPDEHSQRVVDQVGETSSATF